MENIRLNILDSQNIYGTMNSGSIALSNITSDDVVMLMYKHNLRASDLLDYDHMSEEAKINAMMQNNLRPSELVNYKFTKDDKQQILANHRKAFAVANGFDWHKMFMMDQDLEKSGKRESYFEITREYVEANPNGWTDIPEDILITTDKVPGVAIGYPVADCPVIIMEDIKQGVTAVAHCSAELIDSRLPMMIADALNDAYNTKDEDILVAVGPMAGPNWTYTDLPPKWAHDQNFWINTGAITKENNEFKIDLKKAISSQLKERNVGQEGRTIYSNVDTITDSRYYSNAEASKGKQEKYGRQFVGVVYQKTRR